jgi:hypothetical protein
MTDDETDAAFRGLKHTLDHAEAERERLKDIGALLDTVDVVLRRTSLAMLSQSFWGRSAGT